MLYGQLSQNTRINKSIYNCFQYFSVEDQRKFVKKFREQPHDEDQVLHTFRELLLGAFLASNGLFIKYDHKIDGKTPDWSVFNKEVAAQPLIAIIELTNFHVDKKIEDAMKRTTNVGKIWCGWIESNDRLYQSIKQKAEKYEDIAQNNNTSFVVCVFATLMACLVSEELIKPLFEDYGGGLFKQHPLMSGVLFFEESSQYKFTYFPNPGAINPIILPSGIF